MIRFSKLALSICFALALPQWAKASDQCSSILLGGVPQTPHELRIVCHDGFALGHSTSKKLSIWSAERLRGEDVWGEEERDNDFQEDELVPENERSTNQDYLRSHCDRGHLSPAGDFSKNPKRMNLSFRLSNMIPQEPSHNRKIWMTLEKKVRALAVQRKEIIVITGPVFKTGVKTDATVTSKATHMASQLFSMFGHHKKKKHSSINDTTEAACYERETIGRGIPVPAAVFKLVYDPVRHDGVVVVIPNIPEDDLFEQAGVKKGDRAGLIRHYSMSIPQFEASMRYNLMPKFSVEQKNTMLSIPR